MVITMAVVVAMVVEVTTVDLVLGAMEWDMEMTILHQKCQENTCQEVMTEKLISDG